ncbi:unnamed protein product [Euphydryas editha]|uniref:Uncharacterized protein n=1 Tax=Euphydryas editha TaxID=104508 RepID=A0AAU9TER4_EUPED|nr:unnamed protein product [Euphydryas editha]
MDGNNRDRFDGGVMDYGAAVGDRRGGGLDYDGGNSVDDWGGVDDWGSVDYWGSVDDWGMDYGGSMNNSGFNNWDSSNGVDSVYWRAMVDNLAALGDGGLGADDWHGGVDNRCSVDHGGSVNCSHYWGLMGQEKAGAGSRAGEDGSEYQLKKSTIVL